MSQPIALASTKFATHSIKAFFIIFGPAGTAATSAETQDFLATFQRQASIVSHVGDGQSDLDETHIYKTWDNLKQASAVCVIILCHGETRGGIFKIKLAEGKWMLLSRIFQGLTNGDPTKPITVFLPSCHSNCAQVDSLPKASVLVTVADEDFSGTDIERWKDAMATNRWPQNTRAIDLFYLYLVAIRNPYAPMVSVSGGEILKLNQLLSRYVSDEKFDLDETGLVGRIGYEESLRRVIPRLKIARSEWEINATDYGSTLALLLWNKQVAETKASGRGQGRDHADVEAASAAHPRRRGQWCRAVRRLLGRNSKG